MQNTLGNTVGEFERPLYFDCEIPKACDEMYTINESIDKFFGRLRSQIEK